MFDEFDDLIDSVDVDNFSALMNSEEQQNAIDEKNKEKIQEAVQEAIELNNILREEYEAGIEPDSEALMRLITLLGMPGVAEGMRGEDLTSFVKNV